jgi:uroporphyrinogen decarboxylase
LTSRQRIIAALERRIPDRVPVLELVVDSRVIEALSPGDDYIDFVGSVGLDAVAVRPDMKNETLDADTIRDERGLIARRTTQDYYEPVSQVIRDYGDLARFEFPDPHASHRFVSLKRAIGQYKGKLAIIAFLRDGWSEARDLHGFQATLMDLYDNPKLVQGIIEKAVDYYSELGKIAAGLGAEIAFSGDDIAGNLGPLMSPDQFRQIIHPALKRLYRNWHSCGLYVIKHSDGNLYPIVDLLIEAGIDGLHPIDPLAGMSLEKTKALYGDRLCLIGNVACAGNLVFGTPEQVREEVKACIEAAAAGGGYIAASSNSITRDCKPDNYRAMIEAVKQHGAEFYRRRAL